MENLVSSSPNSSTGTTVSKSSQLVGAISGAGKTDQNCLPIDQDLAQRLDRHSLEAIVELKIGRFLDQIGSFYPENLHELIMTKVEKPLLAQILRRTGGNQVHAAKILGINRNTLRKKIKMYGLST